MSNFPEGERIHSIRTIYLSSETTNPERVVLSGLSRVSELPSGDTHVYVESEIDDNSMHDIERLSNGAKDRISSKNFPIAEITKEGLLFLQNESVLLRIDPERGVSIAKKNLVDAGALIRRNIDEGLVQSKKPPYFFSSVIEIDNFAKIDGIAYKGILQSGIVFNILNFNNIWSELKDLLESGEMTGDAIRRLANPYFKFQLKANNL